MRSGRKQRIKWGGFNCRIWLGALFCASIIQGCRVDQEQPSSLEVVFELNDSVQARFPVQVNGLMFTLENGSELIRMPKVNEGIYRVPVFGGGWIFDESDDSNSGFWVDSLRPPRGGQHYRVDFMLNEAVRSESSDSILPGTWDLWFDTENVSEAAESQLDLWNEPGGVGGTVRTPTGDYRFLSGTFRNDSLVLQTFDGAHLYRFDAILSGGQWKSGRFFSGNHYHTAWVGHQAKKWVDDESITSLHVEVDSLFVRIIDRDGRATQLSLQPAPGHVTVLDVLGTWCPNCMDEVRLLKSIPQDHLNILSVAFERDTIPSRAYQRIDQYAIEFDASWPFYLGGKANKQVAAAAFPFLDQVLSFPTTLFIQHDGTVHVHSGFNGPATGTLYELEKSRFQNLAQATTSLENH